jgi:hypothetical protein
MWCPFENFTRFLFWGLGHIPFSTGTHSYYYSYLYSQDSHHPLMHLIVCMFGHAQQTFIFDSQQTNQQPQWLYTQTQKKLSSSTEIFRQGQGSSAVHIIKKGAATTAPRPPDDSDKPEEAEVEVDTETGTDSKTETVVWDHPEAKQTNKADEISVDAGAVTGIQSVM